MKRPRCSGPATAYAAAIAIVLAAGCSAKSAPFDPTRPRTGPASPTAGVSYPYDLMTHCGVRYAYFAAHWWEADSPRQDDPAKGGNPYTGYVVGTMTLTSQTTARFDLPHGFTATFHPLDAQPQPCS
jgi:hypothetical protein